MAVMINCGCSGAVWLVWTFAEKLCVRSLSSTPIAFKSNWSLMRSMSFDNDSIVPHNSPSVFGVQVFFVCIGEQGTTNRFPKVDMLELSSLEACFVHSFVCSLQVVSPSRIDSAYYMTRPADWLATGWWTKISLAMAALTVSRRQRDASVKINNLSSLCLFTTLMLPFKANVVGTDMDFAKE